jgi:Leucine-rich repeat (LRR) protein
MLSQITLFSLMFGFSACVEPLVLSTSYLVNTMKYTANTVWMPLEAKSIVDIEPDTFKPFPRLEELNLNFNRLKQINEKVFDGHPRLNRIHLMANGLEAIPVKLFKNLPNLILIDFDSNRLEEIEAFTFEGIYKPI